MACGIISVEIYGGNMKKTYIYATPLWMYLTELPIIFVLTLAIIHNPSAVGMAKLYPLISLCGLALIFINLYLFRMVRISMAEVRDIGRFSPRDNGRLAEGSSIRIIPTRHGRVRIQVYGKAGLPELDWMRDQTTAPDVICMYRGRAEGGSRAVRRIMKYFHIADGDIDRMLDEVGFHGEYEECVVDTLNDLEGKKEYRITLTRAIEELKVGVKELKPGMTLTAKENAHGEWDTVICNEDGTKSAYRSTKVEKQLATILKEYEISDSDIKEYFSGAETVAENDLIRAVANEEEYRIYIKKQNQQ